MLLLAQRRVVSDARLAAMVWAEDPPATAEAQIQTYVSRLRQRLGSDAPIVRQRPGYMLRIEPEQLDLVVFERLAAEGRAALVKGDTEASARFLRAALSCWRGPALAGVTSFLANAERPRLEEERLAVLEDRIDADLQLGRHAPLVSELTGLAAVHPLREHLRGQLMTALYRSGRQADALATYQAYRAHLVEELGIDPGHDLYHLNSVILADDPRLGRSRQSPVDAPRVAVLSRSRPLSFRPTWPTSVAGTRKWPPCAGCCDRSRPTTG